MRYVACVALALAFVAPSWAGELDREFAGPALAASKTTLPTVVLPTQMTMPSRADLMGPSPVAAGSELDGETPTQTCRWGGGWGGGTTSTQVRDILVGTLVIDMADAGKKQVVWRGMGVKEVDTTAKPEKRDKSINKAVEKIFKNYPPKVKK